MNAQIIEKIVTGCDGSKKSIRETVNRLLAEDTVFKVGDTVASVDEDIAVGGFVGKARIKGFSEDKGWAEIELPNGTITRTQTSLLYAVS